MAVASWLHLGRSALEAGMLPAATKSVARRLRSNVEAVGLRRDLAVPFEAPRAAIPIKVRPLAERDVPHLLEPNVARLSAEERWDRASRKLAPGSGLRCPSRRRHRRGCAVLCAMAVRPQGQRVFGRILPRRVSGIGP